MIVMDGVIELAQKNMYKKQTRQRKKITCSCQKTQQIIVEKKLVVDMTKTES